MPTTEYIKKVLMAQTYFKEDYQGACPLKYDRSLKLLQTINPVVLLGNFDCVVIERNPDEVYIEGLLELMENFVPHQHELIIIPIQYVHLKNKDFNHSCFLVVDIEQKLLILYDITHTPKPKEVELVKKLYPSKKSRRTVGYKRELRVAKNEDKKVIDGCKKYKDIKLFVNNRMVYHIFGKMEKLGFKIEDWGTTKIAISTDDYFENTCSIISYMLIENIITNQPKTETHTIGKTCKSATRSYFWSPLPEKDNERWLEVGDMLDTGTEIDSEGENED